ncbi:TPA_asm: RNA-directed RNA polymerase [ssRNA phage Zoerhiza.1_12]|uniref:RNA-directed RNA polymerase n=2 Tax=Norzivirales TaxID=2842247 RepID=A0A8S5L314_9VIRU|nr:RNA-directed RNA polymerase [ssRNA phage Zoerhiza.1_12]QDH87548.1 MAG: RNA-dependent RNA polymerase [Leviviridae sp.]DAD51775.1 TPA_asm: RNA-directed RNA polymerase [ssRNA phage Zoerhiza.1_12]
MINITALSQYLLEDLHDYHNFDFFRFDSHFTAFDDLAVIGSRDRPNLGESTGGDGLSQTIPFRGTREGTPLAYLRYQGRSGNRPGSPVDDVFRIVLRPAHRANRVRPVTPRLGQPRVGTDLSQVLKLSESWESEASPHVMASRALVRSVPKKFRDEITAVAEDVAHDKFLRINNRCASWRLNPLCSWDEELVGLLKQELDNFFHPGGEPLDLSPNAIFDRGRCGPGASLGANGVDFYTKLFSSKLTATSFDVYYAYAKWCATDPNWRDAEFSRLTSFGLPTITCESSMTFVQKNRDTKRTICTEPSLNMFAQLGIGAILEDRLSSFYGIDLSLQPERNAELARLGSIAGAIGTIDLESASDSLSLGMLDEVLPQWVFDTLCEYRCPFTKLRGERVLLHMISTMGNGFTFPLQTIIFACCVQAVAKQIDVPLRRADSVVSTWGVFGDDIACPTIFSDRLCRLLEILGFHINGEKSFTDKWGTFRESCGHDYYLGHDIRGVYVKSLLTPQSRFVAINLLNEWSARWGIPLIRTIGYLRDSVRVMAIPAWMGPDAGIRVPVEAVRSGLTSVLSSTKRKGSYLFKYYRAVVPSLMVLEDSIAVPRNINHIPRRAYNPAGLLIAAIGGYLRGGRIPLALKQGENPCYRTMSGVTPSWGPSDEQVQLQGSGFWERWKTAILVNLGFESPEA